METVLSRNELRALLSRVFEGMYGHKYDYSAMALTVLWMECYGLEGVSRLVKSLTDFEKKDLILPDWKAVSDNRFEFDGHGQSLFLLGHNLCDLAIATTLSNGAITISVKNVKHRDTLIGSLHMIARQHVSVILSVNGQAFINAKSTSVPSVYAVPETDDIILQCASTVQDIVKFLPDQTILETPDETILNTYAKAIVMGMSINQDHIHALNQVADRILVEASEASRRGAGE